MTQVSQLLKVQKQTFSEDHIICNRVTTAILALISSGVIKWESFFESKTTMCFQCFFYLPNMFSTWLFGHVMVKITLGGLDSWDPNF